RSGFVFFCIKEEGIPIDVLEVDRKILVAFAWEPSGNRFAVIHEGDKGPNLSSVSFYSMVTPPGKVTKLFTLHKKQADSLFWSPTGKLIVLAGLKECFGGKLQFFYVDQRKQVTCVIKHSVNHVVWDPSGRYVATALTIPQQEFDVNYDSVRDDPLERFSMWSSSGDHIYFHQCDCSLLQMDWRPYGGGGIIDDELVKMQKNPFQ
ncbi:unnamed protein product, partial [Brassica oleracea]